MEAIFQSFILVLISEMGDKTQLIALLLITQFKKPWTVMAGILVATLLNHSLAAFVGGSLANFVSPVVLKYTLIFLFVGFGLWILVPDKDEEINKKNNYGAFLTTLVVFFLAEMGDKTQLATMALGAQFNSVILVTVGSTMGMLVADGLAVFLGPSLLQRVPLKNIRYVACAVFISFALMIYFK